MVEGACAWKACAETMPVGFPLSTTSSPRPAARWSSRWAVNSRRRGNPTLRIHRFSPDAVGLRLTRSIRLSARLTTARNPTLQFTISPDAVLLRSRPGPSGFRRGSAAESHSSNSPFLRPRSCFARPAPQRRKAHGLRPDASAGGKGDTGPTDQTTDNDSPAPQAGAARFTTRHCAAACGAGDRTRAHGSATSSSRSTSSTTMTP